MVLPPSFPILTAHSLSSLTALPRTSETMVEKKSHDNGHTIVDPDFNRNALVLYH